MPFLEFALSVQQPYAEAIMRGSLDHTTRDRSLAKHVGERVYLYASSDVADDEHWSRYGLVKGSVANNCVVGSVLVVGAKAVGDRFHWMLADPERIALRPINQPQPAFWRPEFDAS